MKKGTHKWAGELRLMSFGSASQTSLCHSSYSCFVIREYVTSSGKISTVKPLHLKKTTVKRKFRDIKTKFIRHLVHQTEIGSVDGKTQILITHLRKMVQEVNFRGRKISVSTMNVHWVKWNGKNIMIVMVNLYSTLIFVFHLIENI